MSNKNEGPWWLTEIVVPTVFLLIVLAAFGLAMGWVGPS
jgi:hypothetical protein